MLILQKGLDRDHDRQYAMEDFCQLSNRVTADKYKGSYENCGRIIRKYSRNVGLDNTELFYRLLFCFVTGNSDMHLKNFSLIEDKPVTRTHLLSSPAYDLLPVNIIMPSDKEQMALTVNGKKETYERRTSRLWQFGWAYRKKRHRDWSHRSFAAKKHFSQKSAIPICRKI